MSISWRITTGLVRVLVISTMVSPDVLELPDSDSLPVQDAALGVADRLAAASLRASAIDGLERVAVGGLAPVEVLERPRSSASADVLDGLGYWR